MISRCRLIKFHTGSTVVSLLWVEKRVLPLFAITTLFNSDFLNSSVVELLLDEGWAAGVCRRARLFSELIGV